MPGFHRDQPVSCSWSHGGAPCSTIGPLGNCASIITGGLLLSEHDDHHHVVEQHYKKSNLGARVFPEKVMILRMTWIDNVVGSN